MPRKFIALTALLIILLASGLILTARIAGGATYTLDRTCDTVNHRVSETPPARTIIDNPSTDGRFHLYGQTEGMFIRDSETGHVLKLRDRGGNWFQGWSPTRNQLAVLQYCDVLRGDAWGFPLGANVLTLYDFSDGLEHYTTQLVNLRLQNWNEFRGWSPDGAHFITQSEGQSLQIWSVDNAELVYDQRNPVWGRYWWSPNGKAIALVAEDEPNELILLGVADRREVVYPLTGDLCGDNIDTQWTPDQQAVLYLKRVCAPGDPNRLAYYRLDGRAVTHLADNFYQPVALSLRDATVSPRWSDGGANLYFWDNPQPNQYQFKRYQPATDTLETLLDYAWPPFYALDPSRQPYFGERQHMALLQLHPDQTWTIEIANAEASQIVPFVNAANLLGNLYWFAAGDRIAAEFQDETGLARVAWMKVDGSGYQTYANPAYFAFSDLFWSPDGSTLIFQAHHADASRDMLLADAETGEVTLLQGRIAATSMPSFDDPVAHVKFAWMDFDTTEWHYNAYDRRGRAVFNLEYHTLWFNNMRTFWSPDERYVAIKLNSPDGEALLVAQRGATDYVVAMDGLSGLGDPVWSETSDSIHFTWSFNFSPIYWRTFSLGGSGLFELSELAGRVR